MQKVGDKQINDEKCKQVIITTYCSSIQLPVFTVILAIFSALLLTVA
jgi:hypothetical protein